MSALFEFYLGNCYGCGRYTTLQGKKKPKCYDCKTLGVKFVRNRMKASITN